jgi:hypothetical protein
LSVPATLNLPFLNSMSASAASSRWAAIFLPLAIDLVGRLDDGRAADRSERRAVGAHAERHPCPVSPWTTSIIVDRHAEPVVDTSCAKVVSWPCPWLCEPVMDRHVAGRVDPDLADSHKPTPAPSEPTACEGAMPQASI